jgi:hypothetical protein
MNSILFMMLFVGILFIIDGYYRDQIEYLKKNTKTVYKFIPRNQYDDSLGYLNYDMFDSSHDARSAGRPDSSHDARSAGRPDSSQDAS